MNINEPPGRSTRSRLRLAEYKLQIKYKTGSDNAQANALSRLLTCAPTELNYPDDVPVFIMEPEADPQSDDAYPYSNNYFIEDDYSLLLAEREEPRDLHILKITVEELLLAQLHDYLCSKIHHKIYGAETSPFRND